MYFRDLIESLKTPFETFEKQDWLNPFDIKSNGHILSILISIRHRPKSENFYFSYLTSFFVKKILLYLFIETCHFLKEKIFVTKKLEFRH